MADTKIHKINVTLHTPEEWTSNAVAETVKELLMMDNEDDGPFTEIVTVPDPVNGEEETGVAIEESLSLIRLYTDFLKIRISDGGAMNLFREGVEKLEHGITDLNACIRCMHHISDKLPFKVMRLQDKDLDDAPEEILHVIAHDMGLDRDTCHTLSRDDIVKWIRERAHGETTIN